MIPEFLYSKQETIFRKFILTIGDNAEKQGCLISPNRLTSLVSLKFYLNLHIYFTKYLQFFLPSCFIANTMKIIRAYYVLQVTRIITDNTYCCQGSNKLSSFKHAVHPSLPWKTGLPGPGPLMPEKLPGAIALGRMDSCNRPVQAVKVSWGHLGRSFWYPGHLECLHQCFWVFKVPVIPLGIL